MKIRYLSVCCGLLVLSGCFGGGSGKDKQKVYSVSGKITMGGAPVPEATVTYAPEGTQPVAMGRTNSDGEYRLTTYSANDGAAAGDYTVLVMKTAVSAESVSDQAIHEAIMSGKSVPGSNHAGGKSGGDSGALLPDVYGSQGSSPLKACVTAGGENKFDFELAP